MSGLFLFVSIVLPYIIVRKGIVNAVSTNRSCNNVVTNIFFRSALLRRIRLYISYGYRIRYRVKHDKARVLHYKKMQSTTDVAYPCEVLTDAWGLSCTLNRYSPGNYTLTLMLVPFRLLLRNVYT